MITINLGIYSSSNIQTESAYGILRSSFLPIDAAFLAVQGAALGLLFGNPMLGAMSGIMISVTDRLFSPIINFLPGNSYSLIGLPLGFKNIVLASASVLASIVITKMIAGSILRIN